MLTCGLAKWSDMISPWFKKLLAETNRKVVPRRKQWEAISTIQTFKERGLLKPGSSGLVFAVGAEWLPSFFVSKGCKILTTDLSIKDKNAKHWIASGQICADASKINNIDKFVTDEQIKTSISFRNVDMNSIPDDIKGFDFCWSLCALEHLGSKKAGLDFMKNSLKCIKPGGWAFHSTEFNIDNSAPVYETENNSFYQVNDIEELANELEQAGHYIEPRDYSLGEYLEDYPIREPDATSRHMKIFSGEDHLITSIRLIVRNKNAEH